MSRDPKKPYKIILENGAEIIWRPSEDDIAWGERSGFFGAQMGTILFGSIDEPESVPLPLDTKWWTGPCICSICQHEQQVVIEIDSDQEEPIVPMECGECGNQAMMPKEE